jgi:hypothetical protein
MVENKSVSQRRNTAKVVVEEEEQHPTKNWQLEKGYSTERK